ncbi:hypothetical protein Mgra_00004106 [Meloidogyne graminicola]|uniref:Uncharacterized protein n=1 Tax=Meloidogyne graminicola TaxID=189291 RepID=A0A8S9ZTE5_9BILA|nr:hypothetical protein Mgra_00004106 [Meloidogyne graminicola]
MGNKSGFVWRKRMKHLVFDFCNSRPSHLPRHGTILTANKKRANIFFYFYPGACMCVAHFFNLSKWPNIPFLSFYPKIIFLFILFCSHVSLSPTI